MNDVINAFGLPKNPKIRIALKIDPNTVDTHTAQNVFIYEKTKTVTLNDTLRHRSP